MPEYGYRPAVSTGPVLPGASVEGVCVCVCVCMCVCGSLFFDVIVRNVTREMQVILGQVHVSSKQTASQC